MKTITVTKEDIDNGNRGDCKSCPVSLAMKRELGAYLVMAGTKTIRVFPVGGPEAEYDRYHSPASVHDFIVRFDNSLPVQPFSFELE